MNFINSIKNVTKTRKFWVGVLAAVVNALLVYLANVPEFTPVISLLSAYGVWRVPNKVI